MGYVSTQRLKIILVLQISFLIVFQLGFQYSIDPTKNVEVSLVDRMPSSTDSNSQFFLNNTDRQLNNEIYIDSEMGLKDSYQNFQESTDYSEINVYDRSKPRQETQQTKIPLNYAEKYWNNLNNHLNLESHNIAMNETHFEYVVNVETDPKEVFNILENDLHLINFNYQSLELGEIQVKFPKYNLEAFIDKMFELKQSGAVNWFEPRLLFKPYLLTQ